MSDEDEEEYQEVDPMEVIEDRLMLLEAWLMEDPYHDDINHKREEYLSLMEELDILGKKMRKTDKLLNKPNPPNRGKLERKREQYEREVQDIVLYAEQDPFFEVEGVETDTGEAALNTYMRANSLLGQPLETLTEMCDFEDSQAWNESSPALNFDISDRTPRNFGSTDMDLSKPHNITVLKKKIKKAKQLLQSATNEKDRKKMHKKYQEYKSILADIETSNSPKAGEGSPNEGDDQSQNSEGSIDVTQSSPMRIFKVAQQRRAMIALATKELDEAGAEDDEEFLTLRKKLAKATKLVQKKSASKDEKVRLDRKIREYLVSILSSKLEKARLNAAIAKSKKERKKAAARVEEYERTLDSFENLKIESLSPDDFSTTSFELSSPKPRGDGKVVQFDGESQDVASFVERDRKKAEKTLRKKVKKVERLLADLEEELGQEVVRSKEYRKLQKKKKEYLSQLGDDHGSLADLSEYNPDGSTRSLMDFSVMTEHTGASQSLLIEGDDVEENETIILLKKKLKKVDKLLGKLDPDSNTANQLKIKRRQYLSELGIEE